MNTEKLIFKSVNNVKGSKSKGLSNDHFEEINFDVDIEDSKEEITGQENFLAEEEFPEETTILLKNFDPKTTNEDLELFFSKVSKFRKSCYFIDKYTGIPRFIYIEFFTIEDKKKAHLLNHTMLMGKIVKIEEKRKIPSSYLQKVNNFSINNNCNFRTGRSMNLQKGFNPY